MKKSSYQIGLIILIVAFLISGREVEAALRTLYPGLKGADVTLLQQNLTTIGIYSDEVTGFYGNKTKAAVIAFQKKYKISTTGTVGPITRAKISNLLSNSIKPLTTPTTIILDPAPAPKNSTTTPVNNTLNNTSSITNTSSNTETSNSITPANTLTLKSPVGGETFYIGNTYQIKWLENLPQGSSVSIYLLRGTSESLLIATNVFASLKSFAWTVPDMEEAGNLKIQIKASTGQESTSLSNFMILQPQTDVDPNIQG